MTSLLALADSLYVDEDYKEAIAQYTAALSSSSSADQLPSLADNSAEKFRALSHRSSAHLKLESWSDALKDAEAALELISLDGTVDITSLRAGEEELCNMRAGIASYQLGQPGLAVGFFDQAGRLASEAGGDCKVYSGWLKRCNDSFKKEEKKREAVPETKEDKKPAAAVATATASPQRASPPRQNQPRRPEMPKYQYYQSDSVLTIQIPEPNVKPEDLRVDFGLDTLTVVLTKQGVDFTVICGTLFDAVDVEKCKVVYKDEKVLIKLRKVEKNEWHELFGAGAEKKAAAAAAAAAASRAGKEETKGGEDGDTAAAAAAAATAKVPEASPTKTRPYASHKDWDAIERGLKKEEEEEKPEGEEALNKLFRDIYGKADEDTKRAMVKSFQTSGGTVLSTNWNEVEKKDYEKERQAPKGQEWKNWEGEKLPQKES